MNRLMYSSSEKKILPFDQNGGFYHKKAQKHIGNNNYIDALIFYRKAVEKEPENNIYKLDLAQAFSEMNYYDESNRLLFLVLQSSENKSECFFGLGCNYIALREYEKAEECFNKYLDIDPSGIYSEDVLELLEILKSNDYYEEDFFTQNMTKSKIKLFKSANKGRELLDAGEYKKAIKCMERILKKDSSLVFVKNNLSLAYYCEGDINKAVELTNEILALSPGNIHANCNLAIMQGLKEGDVESQALKNTILNFKTIDPDELHKIAVTLCELKLHKEANVALKDLLQYKPYDTKILHCYAVSLFNLKDFKAALALWNKISKIEPDNMISSYYKKFAQKQIKEKAEAIELDYHYQVPYSEIILRFKKLSELIQLDITALKSKWAKSNTLFELFSWGLTLKDLVIKKKILHTVASIGDRKAEYFIRDFSIRKNSEEELIKESMILLKQMGASEPYLAYMNDNVVEIKVDALYITDSVFSETQQLILDYALGQMQLVHEQGYATKVEKLWKVFLTLKSEKVCKSVSKPLAWSAALEIAYCTFWKVKYSKSEVASRYGVAISTLERNFTQIKNVVAHEADKLIED